MKKFNIAKDFSINIYGLSVPKNAVYGKIGRNYFYVDDYKQFLNIPDRYTLYVLSPAMKSFRKITGKLDNKFIQQLEEFILDNIDCENTTCVYPFKLGHSLRADRDNYTEVKGFIRAKEAQSNFIYRPSNADTKHAITDVVGGTGTRWAEWNDNRRQW